MSNDTNERTYMRVDWTNITDLIGDLIKVSNGHVFVIKGYFNGYVTLLDYGLNDTYTMPLNEFLLWQPEII